MREMMAVVLAAGASRRMGRPKALLEFGEGTFVGRVVETLRAAGIADVLVVTRAELAEDVAGAVSGARVVVNRHPEEGMQSSLRVALEGVAGKAIVLAVVDQPHLQVETVRRLLQAFRAAPGCIIVPRSAQKRRGHPAFFPADLVDELRAAHEKGVREVLWRHPERVREVEVDDEAPFANINTPADLEALLGLGNPDP